MKKIMLPSVMYLKDNHWFENTKTKLYVKKTK